MMSEETKNVHNILSIANFYFSPATQFSAKFTWMSSSFQNNKFEVAVFWKKGVNSESKR